MQAVIEKLVYQGYGLARVDGKTRLVRWAAPGDRVVDATGCRIAAVEGTGVLVVAVERLTEAG